jgi:1,4-alpha-glucan branching enzyme
MKASIFNPRSMGAIPSEKSTTFKVWAPNATSVAVVGEFNDWNASDHPLSSSDSGIWSAEVPGAKTGQQYQFEIVNGDKRLRKNDAYAREIHLEKATSVIYKDKFEWKFPHCILANWNDLVIYELHVGNFAPGSKDTPGRFAQVASRLPYLKSLGVNAIEIMPPMAFPGERSWGYNLTNPFAVEGTYGGPNGLKRLVDAAHEHGIGVIIDVVCNHFGPDNLDLWQYDGWSENNKGGIYFYNDERSATPWGENRPNYGRNEVRQYIRDYALLWLDEFHVDGMRLDSTIFIRNWRGENNRPECDLPEGWSLMHWINEEAQRHFPGRITIAEDIQQNHWITKTTGEGGMGYSTQWDGAFIYPIRESVVAMEDAWRSMSDVATAIQFRYNEDAIQRVIYSESHDSVANGQSRIPQEISGDDAGGYHARKRSTLAAGIVLTTPGIPMLFEGQEFLEDGSFRDNEAVDWSKLETFKGINRMYRDMIHLRRNLFGNTKGLLGPFVRVQHINDGDKILAFHRWAEGGPKDDVIVVASFTHRDIEQGYRIGFPHEGEWTIRFNSDWKGYSPDFHDVGNPEGTVTVETIPADGFEYSGVVALPSYGILILSQEVPKPK